MKRIIRHEQKPHVGEDLHHLLWTRRMYNKGWARILRSHPYCQSYIPRDTLHRKIHHEISSIPLPDGADAHNAFELLLWKESRGELDFSDSILQKLDFLIENLATEATVKALERQRQVVLNFCERR